VIQSLLRENGAAGLDESSVRIIADGAEAPPSEDGRSPETYAGYEARIKSVGTRRIVERRRRAQRASGGIRQGGVPVPLARLHMVLGSATNGAPVRFRLTLNGTAPVRLMMCPPNSRGQRQVIIRT